MSRALALLLLASAASAFVPIKPPPRSLVALAPKAAVHGHVARTTVHASALTAVSLPAATGIAAAAGTLAYIRQAYIFSLSYGLSMAGIGGAVLLAAPASPLLKLHAGLVTAYGVRLFLFLFWRQKFQPGYDGEARLKALDKTPRLKRTPIILSTSLFYGFMASPLLFHLRAAPLVGAAASVSAAGAALAAVGFVYEAVADQQKSLFKMRLRAEGAPDALYTGGLYAASRHPNYAGEMAFWLGSFVAGMPALFAAGVPLYVRALRGVAGALGLAGIFFIMLSATKRLEARQAEKWRPSAMYDNYYLSSNPLLPKLM